MANTISGSTGVSGSQINYSGTASGTVFANASGNYTIPGLLAGPYTITPVTTGYTYSPANSAQTVAGADISGVNFTVAPVTPTGLSFSLLGADQFAPDANPLNPAFWTLYSTGFLVHLKAVSGKALSDTDFSEAAEYYVGVASPNDQFIQITVAAYPVDGSEISLLLRSDATPDNYYGLALFSNGDATSTLILLVNTIAGGPVVLVTINPITIAVSDVFTFAIVGTQLFVLQNGVQIATASDATIASGRVGLDLSVDTATSLQISNFSMGSAAKTSVVSPTVGGATIMSASGVTETTAQARMPFGGLSPLLNSSKTATMTAN